ncbi:MAG: acyltransferase family protein [Janthinobacterium lividum]
MTAQKLVFDRIAMLRYLMIVGVVVLHTPPYVPVVDIGPGMFDFVKSFFQNAAFRATVPVLTLISGYLLFRSGLDQDWVRLLKRKIRTIALPFLVFNLIVLAGAFAAQYLLGLRMSYQLIPFDAPTWLDAAFSISASPVNYPLHFLRDLMVLMLLSPLLRLALHKCPWVGLAAMILVFFNNLDGTLILREVMPVMFYVGGLAATRNWNLLALDRYALPSLGLLVVLCAFLVYFRIGNTTYFRFVAPFLIWSAAALLHDTRPGRWLQSQSKVSFFIFLAHAPLLLVSSVAYQILGEGIPYPLYWAATPVLIVAILSVAYHAFMRICPRLFAPLIGAKPPVRDTAQPLSVPARMTP